MGYSTPLIVLFLLVCLWIQCVIVIMLVKLFSTCFLTAHLLNLSFCNFKPFFFVLPHCVLDLHLVIFFLASMKVNEKLFHLFFHMSLIWPSSSSGCHVIISTFVTSSLLFVLYCLVYADVCFSSLLSLPSNSSSNARNVTSNVHGMLLASSGQTFKSVIFFTE